MKEKRLVAVFGLIAVLLLSSMAVFIHTMAKSHQLSDADIAVLRTIFDADFYAERYPDVVKVHGADPEALFTHFCLFGIDEGREPFDGFNVFAYKSAYEDLRLAYGDDNVMYYLHYALLGKTEGRDLITLDACKKAGIVVTDFNGKVILDPFEVPENPSDPSAPPSVEPSESPSIPPVESSAEPEEELSSCYEPEEELSSWYEPEEESSYDNY